MERFRAKPEILSDDLVVWSVVGSDDHKTARIEIGCVDVYHAKSLAMALNKVSYVHIDCYQ